MSDTQASSEPNPQNDSTATNPSESQISFKKHTKIKNEINIKRRQALKEFYKLQEQQAQLNNNPLPRTTVSSAANTEKLTSGDSDDELEDEIRSGKPLESIDLQNSEFKTILKHVNRLSSSVNLINSDIKNIIYNNYYELIKLNDFLREMGEGKLENSLEGQSTESTGLLDLLKGMNKNNSHESRAAAASVQETPKLSDLKDLNHLQTLMSQIKEHVQSIEPTTDQLTPTPDSKEQEDQMKTSLNLTNLINDRINESSEDLEKYEKSLDLAINETLDQLKRKSDGKEVLIRQLKELKAKADAASV